MVDITPERRLKDMKKILTKTDRGELEFQIGFFTELTAKALMHNDDNIDVLLIQHHDTYSSLMYIAKVTRKDYGLSLDELRAINGLKDEESMMGVTFAFDHAITIFNSLWVR